MPEKLESVTNKTDVLDVNRSVSDIVRSDYRTALVFRKYGINYCCGGMATVSEVCIQLHLDPDLLVRDLEQAIQLVHLPANLQFNEWDIDFLIDYIINVHHAYLYKVIPELTPELESFVTKHKKQYPQLEGILLLFTNLSNLLITHNRNEDTVIFPYIKQLHSAFTKSESYGKLFVRTLRKPLDRINAEHTHIARLLSQLKTVTNKFQFPDNACTKHQVIYSRLHEFHNDIVQHKHLENNILYTRAGEIEKQLLSD